MSLVVTAKFSTRKIFHEINLFPSDKAGKNAARMTVPRDTSEEFPQIGANEKWTSGSRGESKLVQRIASYRILYRIFYRVASYRGKYRVERSHARPLYCSMEKENEGEDGAEPRRQSATGNLKSCANTQATRELDRSQGGCNCGRVWRAGSRPWNREGFPSILGRLRSRNYVVPSNSHPNDSWMIKARLHVRG